MDGTCQNLNLDPKYLLSQLNTARNEINNLRQQIKSLRYIYDKDVDNIKRLLGLCSESVSICSPNTVNLEEQQPSTSSTADENLKLKPIGVISTWFPNKRGTPRQPGICEKAPGKVKLFNSVFTNPEHALEGLHEFSHMWILFHFHRNDSTHIRAKVAPPRLNGTRIGVFSTRSPHRPCPIGLSLVKIIKIERNIIYFEGVDMVDQTPVLDIKPYIPQYDNPLHIEKLHMRPSDGSETLESVGNGLRETDTNDTLNNDVDSDSRSTIDISRDEELALRLQAEEFQGNSTFDGLYNNSSLENDLATLVSQATEINRERMIYTNSSATFRSAVVSSDSVMQYLRQTPSLFESRNPMHQGRNADLQSDEIRDTVNRIQDVNIDSLDESSFTEDQLSRNSRLLDGADGPSTVCGTDLDLINRRALTSRLDNSPIRMGIREAPDGEEGFESQTLTPSQTVPNIQSAARISYAALPESISIASTPSIEVRNTRGIGNEINSADVRVPDWISRPQNSPLSVVFHERALIQMNEILNDKADEEKRAIENVLREDPRSVYLRQRWGNQFYTFLIHDLHITCRFDDSRRIVTVFQVRHAGRICECGEPEWQCLGHSPLT